MGYSIKYCNNFLSSTAQPGLAVFDVLNMSMVRNRKIVLASGTSQIFRMSSVQLTHTLELKKYLNSIVISFVSIINPNCVF